MDKERPKVGVWVIVLRKGRILIGERLSGHGNKTFQIPGGHLEFGESFEDCAKREVSEETGLTDLKFIDLVSVGNDINYDKHYISIGILLESEIGEPYNTEPDISQNWNWLEIKDIPENLFLPSKKVINNWLNKTIYSD